MKLFDLSNEEMDSEIFSLSNEEMLISKLDEKEIDSDYGSIVMAVESAYEAAGSLSQALNVAELALEDNNISKRDVLNLRNAINVTLSQVGLSNEMNENVSIESIEDPVTELKLSIEEGKSFLTKIINGIDKTYARFNNILIKYISKFDTFLNSIGTNLSKDKKKLLEIKKSGKELTDKKIADGTFLKWHGLNLMGAYGIGEMDDPVGGMKDILDMFKDPNYVNKATDAIISMAESDKPLKPLFNGEIAMKAIERTLGKKIKNFFCKSTKDDRMVIGAIYSSVFILERCKPLHITSKKMPYGYSVVTYTVPSTDFYGHPTTFKTPKIDDLIKLIDEAMLVIKNRKKVLDNIHGILKIGSDTIAKIDEKTNWESSNIYAILPNILFVISKSYAEVPNSVDALCKIYIKEAE